MTATDDALRSDVELRLEPLRPRLRGHGGDVSVESVDNGHVKLNWHGACRSCPVLALTLGALIEPALRDIEGVRALSSVGRQVSESAIKRVRAAVGATIEVPSNNQA